MPSEREQILVNMFWAIAGEGWRGVLAELLGLPVGTTDAETRRRDDAATTAGDTATGRRGDSATEVVGSTVVRNVWGQVASFASLGTVPLAKALIGLFGGAGGREEPAPLTRFTLPPAVRFETALSERGALREAEYDQAGMPRTERRADAAPQITVQVQAMDSRSFLDHSDEIARAVREAMLNMHSLNDVVSEL